MNRWLILTKIFMDKKIINKKKKLIISKKNKIQIRSVLDVITYLSIVLSEAITFDLNKKKETNEKIWFK